MLLALALGMGFTSQAQTVPQPVALTGFNADIVANGTGNATAGSSSNSSVDANSYVFLSNDYTTTTAPGFFHPNVGLPFGGTFLGAALPNVLYKLQPYSGNNSLRLYGVGGSSPAATATGTLTFTNPTSAGTLYVLATSGSGSDATTARVNFSDGTSQSATITVQDWFNNSGYAYSVNDRLLITGTNFDEIIANTVTPNPRLYQYAVAISGANQSKSITGVTFTKSATAGPYVQIMAISAAPPAAANNYLPMPLTFPAGGTPAPYNGGNFGTPSVSGQDVIVNGTSGNTITAGTTSTPYTNTSATADTDGAGYFLMSTDYNSSTTAHATSGLPVAGVNGATTTGLLSSIATSGLTYQLASYTGINALQIRGVGSGSVSFTPTAATEVYVLTTSTNGTTSTGTMTVNFSDGTSHAYAVNFNNWFSAASSATSGSSNAATSIGVYAKGRLQPSNAVQTSTTTPNLFENKLVLSGSEYGKTIMSITVANTSTSNAVSVLGVTLNANAASLAQCALPTSHSAAASLAATCAGTSFTLTLNGLLARSGYSYQWQYSSNNTSWNNLTTSTSASPYSTGPTNATCTVLNQTTATYYRCLVQCVFDQPGTDSPSASVQVGQTDPVNCFPYPATSTSGCGTYGAVSAVSIAETATPANVVMNKTGLTCGTTTEPYATYGIYRDAATNGTLSKSNDYTLTVTTTNASRAALWIDLNQDGIYGAVLNSAGAPTGEYFGENTNGSGSTTLTFSIPSTSLAAVTNGTVGFRVRTERNNASILATAGNSNATTTTGVTLDYAVLVAGATPCAGTPAATVPTSVTSTACPATTFSLTATGPALGTTGLTYQWEYKPSAAALYTSVPTTITDVNGNAVTTNATTAILTIVNQREATDYRVIITCSNGGASATSPAITIAQSLLANCYCQNANNATNDYLTNVTLQDINNTSGSSQTSTPTGFADYTGSPSPTQTTTLNRNSTYVITVSALSPSSSTPTEMVWIDYDQSGTFEASEYTVIGTQATTGAVTGSTNLTIPATALLGPTRMRVRLHNDATGTGASACANAWIGETEDYLVTIGAEVVCSTPTLLTVSGPAAAPCAGASFTLTTTGATAGQSGFSYQWEKSAAGANSFAPISGATNLSLTTSLTASTDYRIVTTCATGGATAPSNIFTVTLGYLNCYCTPSATPTNEYVSAVSMTGSTPFTNTTGGTSSTSAGYNNYTGDPALTTTLNQGGIYPITVSIRANASPSQAALWIDFDHNGTFDPTDNVEYYLLGTPASSGNYTYTINVTVPANAPLGATRMRVRERNSLFANTAACDASGYGGETEDYLFTVGPPQQCTNPPATITATADVTNACANSSFTLSTSSIPVGTTGYTFQWQSRLMGSGNAFADITGATAFSYAVAGQTVPTDYQLIVSCANGGAPVTSNSVAVGQNTYDQCYCSVVHGSGCSTYGAITNVSINGMSNGTTCAGGSNYTVVPTTTATATLTKGTSYTLNTTFASSPSISAGVWVDYNHNGTFDASEFNSITSAASNGTLSTSMTVPATAMTGATRMRIRTESTGVALVTASRGCDTFVYGETEDYTFNVVAPLPVKLISFTAAAQDKAVHLDWVTASELHSERFEVERSTDGKTFELIGTVAAQGNSTHRTDYEFLDSKALAKATTRYYRLRQVDTDGAAEYSPVRSVQLGSFTHLELYPNPAHRDLSVTGATAGAAVEIFDALGRSVLNAPANTDGQARLTLPAGLPSGVYIVRSGTEVRRLTVE
ncbi:GEVED domain-containing protein [Hymenobacter negativus]|uniref:T9SS type A sorting domain-containing protein n=1 Tax=Hymenobacter negativus TaxID=2795026 RepID=A0ABS3QAW8_9BACT|nr:GEVED domain-containing protein [Hymenobacter negativus]MBO2007959.1 T9SS type A sorting domain-containing protein [Hymenobacter negativus]